jgi:RNA polymerase sigma factor for flagellar operon FliA
LPAGEKILTAKKALPGIDVTQHLRLVKKVAQKALRRCPPTVHLEDLISAGYLGLMHAALRFDASKGVSFESFAEFRIRGAMRDELRDCDVLSRDMRNAAKKLSAAEKILQRDLGRKPEPSELAAHLKISPHALVKLKAKTVNPIVVSANDYQWNVDRVAADTDIFERLAAKKIARSLLAILPEKQRATVVRYFLQECTLQEIASDLGLSESRVSQILKSAIAKLRQHCGAPVVQPLVRNRNAA